MKLLDRLKVGAAIVLGSASWNWRGGAGTRGGYLFSGAKFRGSSIYPSGWDLDNEKLRDASRVAYWDSTQARAIISRLTDNVVGTGLALEYRPVWSLLDGVVPKTDEEKHAFAREVEQRFDLWASSHESDASDRMTFYELQAFEYLNRLRDGETVNVLRYSGDAGRMNPLSIQTILPEQVMTPTDAATLEAAKAAGRRIVDGVEIDKVGRELAIHVAEIDSETGIASASKTTRVPVSGASGRRFVLHPIHADTLGAVRGTPLLAPIVHELKKITDLTVAEIEAAVINAILAVWVKPSVDAPSSRALAGIQARGNATATKTEATETPQTTFDKPGLIVQSLKAGEEVVSFDTKRPNVNATAFIQAITKNLSASVSIPIEVLEGLFGSNYSASRAALILFWRKVEIERAKSGSQFLRPVFEAWFVEEVKVGRIAAPGFFDSPVLRAAWLACAWNGDKQPSIDPLKEANADAARIEQGATTRERVAMEYNGSDAMENIARLKVENVALAEANSPMNPAPAAPADPAQTDPSTVDPNEDQEPGEGANAD